MGKVGKIIAGAVLIVGAIVLASVGQWQLAISAASMGIGILTQPKPPTDLAAQQGAILQNRYGAQQGLPVIYGRARVGAIVADLRTSGDKAKRLTVVTAWCHGSQNGTDIQGIDFVYLGETFAARDGTNALFKYSGHPSDAPVGEKYLMFTDHLGSTSQTVDSLLNSRFPSAWPSTSTGKGIAYSRLDLWYNQDIFGGGLPQIQAVIKGAKVYDPRDATWKWSSNPALCIRDYLTSPIYGLGIPLANIDEQSFIDMANYCDEIVEVPLEGSSARYTCNGVLDTNASVLDNLEKLCSSCRAMIVNEGDIWRITIRRQRTASGFVLNEHNTIEGSWNFILPGAEVPNVVRAQFISAATGDSAGPDYNPNLYQADTTEWPQPGDTNPYLDNDGGYESILTIQLPFTASKARAQQLCMTTLKEARIGVAATASVREEALHVQIGDVIAVTQETPGWTNKLFDVVAMVMQPDTTIQLVLSEYNDAAYDLDPQSTPPDVPGTGLPDPFNPTAPSGLTLVANDSTSLFQADGTTIPRIRMTWTPPNDAFLDHYDIQAKKTADTTWDSWGPATKEDVQFFIGPVTTGESWDVRIRAVNVSNQASSWVQQSITPTITFSGYTGPLFSFSAPGAPAPNNPLYTWDVIESPAPAVGRLSATDGTTIVNFMYANWGTGTLHFPSPVVFDNNVSFGAITQLVVAPDPGAGAALRSGSGIMAAGGITEVRLGFDNVRLGSVGGTPRVMLEDGASTTMWEIDNSAGTFRIYTIGASRLSLTTSLLTLTGIGVSATTGAFSSTLTAPTLIVNGDPGGSDPFRVTGAGRVTGNFRVGGQMRVDVAAASQAIYAWAKGGVDQWQLYQIGSGTELRLWDGTSDRVRFFVGGQVMLPTGPLILLGDPGGGEALRSTGTAHFTSYVNIEHASEAQLRLTYTGTTRLIYFYHNTNGLGLFDSTNARSVWSYDVVANYFTHATAVRITGLAKLLIDGTDASIAAGEIGIAESGGGLTISSRASVAVDLDNDNNNVDQAFYIRNNGGSNLYVLGENSAQFFAPLVMNGLDISQVNSLHFSDPGTSEGLVWDGGNGWAVYEAPDDLSNAAGNLQITRSGVRYASFTTGQQFTIRNQYGSNYAVGGDYRMGMPNGSGDLGYSYWVALGDTAFMAVQPQFDSGGGAQMGIQWNASHTFSSNTGAASANETTGGAVPFWSNVTISTAWIDVYAAYNKPAGANLFYIVEQWNGSTWVPVHETDGVTNFAPREITGAGFFTAWFRTNTLNSSNQTRMRIYLLSGTTTGGSTVDFRFHCGFTWNSVYAAEPDYRSTLYWLMVENGVTFSGTKTFLSDITIGNLGVFDAANAGLSSPTEGQLLRWNAAYGWHSADVQLTFNSGVMVAATLSDGTNWTGANDGRTLNGTAVQPPVPIVTPIYGGFVVDMGAVPPAGVVYELFYSVNSGADLGPLVFSSQKIIHQIVQKNGTGVYTSSDGFRYRCREHGSTTSSLSSYSTSATYSVATEVNAFGLIIASQISTVNLAAIVADFGVITAGLVEDPTFAMGIRVSSGYSLPTSWNTYLDLPGQVFVVRDQVIPDASFEVSVGDVHTLASTAVLDTAHVRTGGKALKVTTTNASSGVYFSPAAGGRYKATAARSYAAGVWFYGTGSALGKTFYAAIEWYDSSGTIISGSSGPTTTIVSGWQYISVTATAPAGTGQATPTFYTNGAQGVFDVWLDDVSFGTARVVAGFVGNDDYGLQVFDSAGATVMDFTGDKRILAVPIQTSVDSSSAITVDLSTGLTQQIRLTSSAVTLTLSNPVNGGRYRIWFQQDETGSRPFPTVVSTDTYVRVMYTNDTKPTLTITPGAFDIFEFEYRELPSKRYTCMTLQTNVLLPSPLVQSVTNTTFSASSSHPVTMPATVNAGDLLIVFSDLSMSGPAGWTSLNASLKVYAKVADGTEGGTTPTWTTGGVTSGCAQTYRISNWFGSLSGVQMNRATATIDPPSLTAAWGVDRTLWLVFGIASGGTVTTQPGGYTNLQPVGDIGTARRTLYASSQDPTAFSQVGGAVLEASTLAIRPPA